MNLRNYSKFLIKNFHYATLIVLVFFVNKSCDGEKTITRLSDNIGHLEIEKQSFVSEISDKNKEITYQSQILLTQKEAIENNLVEIKKLKKLKSKVRIVTQTTIDTLFIPFSEKLSDVSLSQNKEMPFKFVEPEKWFTISGAVTTNGLRIDNLTNRNEFSIYISDRKMSLFKKAEPQVILLNKNPYSQTIEMSNIIIVHEKAFYKKNWFWASVGFLGGVYLMKQ